MAEADLEYRDAFQSLGNPRSLEGAAHMKQTAKLTIPAVILILPLVVILSSGRPAYMQQPAAPAASATHFHHVHLNSMNPAAATDYYIKAFPTSTKTSFGGFDGLKTANVSVLFTKVNTPPPTAP